VRLPLRILIAALSAAAVLPAAESTADLNAAATAAHGKRDLGTASALYRRVLAADAPTEATAEQRALARQFAPRLMLVAGEFFPLKDIVAILHPDKPLIGYHLFWEDDLGFPSDNNPCDHEVVWVEYDPATKRVTKVSTYWHGRIVSTEAAAADANSHGGRPWIGVEWGFHGSVPWQAPGNVAEVDRILRDHWEKAHTRLKAQPADPLARGWPREFAGDFAAFTKWTVPFDPRPMLRERGLVFVSRWPNATLNRWALRYNFAAKMEWP